MAFRQVKKMKTFKSTIKVTCVRSGKTRKIEKFKNSSDGSTSVSRVPADQRSVDSPIPVCNHVTTASFEEGELSMVSDK